MIPSSFIGRFVIISLFLAHQNISSNIPSTARKQLLGCMQKYASKLAIASSVVSLAYLPTEKSFGATDIQSAAFQNLQQAADIIKTNCKTTLNAVQATGRLMYRGVPEDSNLQYATLVTSASVLLDEKTYSSLLATDYFHSLDESMVNHGLPLSPGTCHIATSDIYVASEWGTPVSVWPLDNDLHYAWLKFNSRLWDDSWGVPQGPRGPFFWKNKKSLDTFVEKDLRCDNGLEAALANGKEIMFHCNDATKSELISKTLLKDPKDKTVSSFIIVPLSLEPQLLSLLNIQPFSTSAKVKKGSSMEMDGDPVKRKFFISPSIR